MTRVTALQLGVVVVAGLVLGGCSASGRAVGVAPVGEPSGLLVERLLLGHSVRGQPIRARRRGHGALRVVLIGLIHGNEREGFDRFDELWARLDTPPIVDWATLWAIPTMNPDGADDGTRGNANGVDLNRNWPASNFRPSAARGPRPLSEPETRAVHALFESMGPDLVIVLHSTASGPFVDPDGPAIGPAAAFCEAAGAIDPRWRVVPEFSNPAGSLGSYLGLDRGVAVLTVEFGRGQDAGEALRAAAAGIPAAIERAASGSGPLDQPWRRSRVGG